MPSATLNAMSKLTCTAEKVTADDAIAALAADWDRLSRLRDVPNPFTTFDWYRAWQRRFALLEPAGRRSAHVVVLRKDGAISGIAPLVRTIASSRTLWMRRLQFMSDSHEWDYNDLLVGESAEEAATALFEFLKETGGEWDVTDLRNLRDRDGSLEQLLAALLRVGLPYRLLREEERCPYMIVDGPWEELLSRKSSSTRHSIRNRQSRLQRMAGDQLRMRIVENPQDEPGLLEKMTALGAQAHEGEQAEPFLSRHPEAFSAIFETLGPKQWMCVALLEVGERLLAWHLLFRCGKALWGYLTAYDHEYAQFSPGKMLLPAIVDYAFAHGYSEYDFLSGEEPYKMQWNTGFHHTYRLVVWNRRWLSRLRAAAYLRFRVAKVEADTHEPQSEPVEEVMAS